MMHSIYEPLKIYRDLHFEPFSNLIKHYLGNLPHRST